MTRLATVRSATLDIASIVCDLSCRYAKPVLWAQQFPAFLSSRPPDVCVDVEYRHRQRRLPWFADGVVADRPTLRDHGLLLTSYYEARLEDGGRRVRVRIQPGFGVDGLMRALWTILLDSHDAVLLRARRVVRAGASTLVVPGETCVAVARRGEGWVTFATPFGATAMVSTNAAAPLRSLVLDAAASSAASRTGAVARAVELVGGNPEITDRMLNRVFDLARWVGSAQGAHAYA